MLREDITRLKRELASIREAARGNSPPEMPTKRSNSDTYTHNPTQATSMSPLGSQLTPPGASSVSPAASVARDETENYGSQIYDLVAHPGPFILGDVKLTLDHASQLHDRFVTDYLPFVPVFESHSAGMLYSQSETLFWTVIITAASASDPELYMRLAEPLKQLVIDVCWLHTARSTYVVQALLVLATWPLPSEKVLDDMSFRFTTLARSLALQLGMHRGKYIYEFSRKQRLMPNAIKWRTRTWILTYISEQFLSGAMGLPSNGSVDYLIDQGVSDPELPESLRALLKLAVFHGKMVSIMGSSILSPDGLIAPKMRGPTLDVLDQDLELMGQELPLQIPFIKAVFLYVRCMLCCFAFMPDTPEEDQSRFIVSCYHAATDVIALVVELVSNGKKITDMPAIIRRASSLSSLLLFRLHLAPQFPQQFVESARQSVARVYRMYRQVTVHWQGIQNVAKILEGLNHVLIAHPDLLTGQRKIMTRMRSRISDSIFYELIWAIHEARRRNSRNPDEKCDIPQPLVGPEPQTDVPPVAPLPLFTNPAAVDAPQPVPVYATQNGAADPQLSQMAAYHANQQHHPHQLDIPSVSQDIDSLLQGMDWMTGDDFLGWMPSGEFAL